MADQLACDINFFFYIRFVLGFYHEFQTSQRMRRLARCYCCLVFVFHLVLVYSSKPNGYTIFVICVTLSELLFYTVYSLLVADKYLLQYYKKTPLIDAGANNYRSIRVYFMIIMCVMTALKILRITIDLAYKKVLTLSEVYYDLSKIVGWICIIMGRLPGLLVFTLLYSRMRLMRQTLESNDFDCGILGKHHPRRYIQMYEAIMDQLEASDGYIKFQLFILMARVFIGLSYGTLNKVNDMRHNRFGNLIEYAWFVMDNSLLALPLFLSAVMIDLVTLEVQEMLRIIVERCISSKNERDRAEIQKLYQYLKSIPFKYIVWGVVPLNVHSILSFTSYCITTIIAILQINDWVA